MYTYLLHTMTLLLDGATATLKQRVYVSGSGGQPKLMTSGYVGSGSKS